MNGSGGITTTTLLSPPSKCLLHTTIPTYPVYSWDRMRRIGWLGQETGSISCIAESLQRRCGAPDELLTWGCIVKFFTGPIDFFKADLQHGCLALEMALLSTSCMAS